MIMTDTRVHDQIKKNVELDIDRLTDKQSYPESVLKSTAIYYDHQSMHIIQLWT